MIFAWQVNAPDPMVYQYAPSLIGRMIQVQRSENGGMVIGAGMVREVRSVGSNWPPTLVLTIEEQ